MTIIITKKQTKKEIEEKLRQASSNKEAKGLKKHFGLSVKILMQMISKKSKK